MSVGAFFVSRPVRRRQSCLFIFLNRRNKYTKTGYIQAAADAARSSTNWNARRNDVTAAQWRHSAVVLRRAGMYSRARTPRLREKQWRGRCAANVKSGHFFKYFLIQTTFLKFSFRNQPRGEADFYHKFRNSNFIIFKMTTLCDFKYACADQNPFRKEVG